MNVSARLFAAALPIALAACSSGSDSAGQPPPLAGAAMGGPFELISETGETVRESDFEGEYRLIYFGYSYCPDVCPLDMQKIGRGMRALEESDAGLARRVQPIFISVDPDRDTPEVLRQFTDSFHPRIVGMTGTREQIDEVSERYGVYYRIQDHEEGNDRYLVDHSSNTVLYGPEGAPLAIIDLTGSPEEIAGQIARWAS